MFTKLRSIKGGHSNIYNLYNLRDAANLRIKYPRTSPYFQHGLIYSQFYNTSKEMLDTSKVYPFSHENIELLTIDKDLALS